MGPDAFAERGLAELLNIDEVKMLEVQQIFDQSRMSMKMISAKGSAATRNLMSKNADGGSDYEKHLERLKTDPAYRKQVDEIRTSYHAMQTQHDKSVMEKILSVLTRRQRETYARLIGEPFDMNKLLPTLPGGPTPPAKPTTSGTDTKDAATASDSKSSKVDPQTPIPKTLRERRRNP